MQPLAAQILKGDKRALAKAITLVESTRLDHRQQANELIGALMPHTGKSLRIGITGAPGVGKSTFIEALGPLVLEAGHRLAVLAVDPSSSRSGGSILGDKTRMHSLALRDNVFIRPSPAGTSPGGVARRSFETLLLCEAAGFDIVLVETVGVGQSETRVAQMTDLFALLLSPGGGDELQGIKRGIMELADLIAINKADGPQEALARQTAQDYRNALKLMRPRHRNWQTPVTTCSAQSGEGIARVWQMIMDCKAALQQDNALSRQRRTQALSLMWSHISDLMTEALKTDKALTNEIEKYETQVAAGQLPASTAASRLVRAFLAGENDTKRPL